MSYFDLTHAPVATAARAAATGLVSMSTRPTVVNRTVIDNTQISGRPGGLMVVNFEYH